MNIRRFPQPTVPESWPPRQPSERPGAPPRIASEFPTPEPQGKAFDAIVRSEEAASFPTSGPVF
jgi:hypothetical protein